MSAEVFHQRSDDLGLYVDHALMHFEPSVDLKQRLPQSVLADRARASA